MWEDWGRPFGCPKDYLVMNYQNRNPVRKACLPRGYAENVAPDPNGITAIAVQYNHLRFLELKEEEKTFTVDVKMSYHWQDRRIIANDENSKELIVVVPDSEVPAIWKPSPKINNMKMMTPALEPSVYTELMFFLDKNYFYNITALKIVMEYRVTIYCGFKFHAFPFDVQKCQFKDVNRAPDRRTFLMDWSRLVFKLFGTLKPTQNHDARGFHVTVEFKNFTDGNGFEIELKRLIKPHLLQYYLPCSALVGMSFVSFVIPPSAIPGRVGLIATQFLTLTNIFIHHMVIFYNKI